MSTNFFGQHKSKSKHRNSNAKIFCRLIEKSIWSRTSVVAYKSKYYVLAVILTFCAIELILNHIPNEKSDDFFSIEIDDKFDFRHVLNTPKFYPWYGGEQHYTIHTEARNFSRLWEFVSNKSSFLDEPSPLYLVSNGKLYGRSGQHDKIKRQSFYAIYLGRIRQYEQLISASLDVARQAIAHNIPSNQHRQILDLRLHQLIHEPFPFYFIWGDFRACQGKTFPFFTFPTFAQPFPGEECSPLGIPTYGQWKKYKHIRDDAANHWDHIFINREEKYHWNTKINKAVWRGSTTGDATNWRDLPRSKLVQYSLDYPSILDAAFVGVVQRDKTEKKEIASSGFVQSAIPFEDFQNYKAIIDIDGNSWSSRFGDLLCTNSVVIKVEPRWVDYFYSELQPWIHYVPVNGNMSNLVEMVRLVMSEDRQTEMQQITQRANEWCRSKLNARQMIVDMAWILIYYVELLMKEDVHSGMFTQWKHNFSTQGGWNSSNWEEILTN